MVLDTEPVEVAILGTGVKQRTSSITKRRCKCVRQV